MPGLSPINTLQLAMQISSVADAAKASAEAPKPSKYSQSTRDAAIASKNSGCDGNGGALHGNVAKNATFEGKKRGLHIRNESQAKRRKSGNVASSMSVTKPGIASTATTGAACGADIQSHGCRLTDAKAVSAASKAKISVFHPKEAGDDRSSCSEYAASTTRPVAVYAQPISMNTIQTLQPQTTMQSVQKAATGSSTIYERSTAQRSAGTAVVFARPWLQRSAKEKAATANTGHLPPREGDSADQQTWTVQLPTPVYLDSSSHPASSYVRSDSASKQSARTGKTRPCLRTKSDEEFAILDDDDEYELIDLTASIEETVERVQTPFSSERKLKKRDVHRHEDHGSALFPPSVRDLLGAYLV
jgi:hypothetical protein